MVFNISCHVIHVVSSNKYEYKANYSRKYKTCAYSHSHGSSYPKPCGSGQTFYLLSVRYYDGTGAQKAYTAQYLSGYPSYVRVSRIYLRQIYSHHGSQCRSQAHECKSSYSRRIPLMSPFHAYKASQKRCQYKPCGNGCIGKFKKEIVYLL